MPTVSASSALKTRLAKRIEAAHASRVRAILSDAHNDVVNAFREGVPVEEIAEDVCASYPDLKGVDTAFVARVLRDFVKTSKAAQHGAAAPRS